MIRQFARCKISENWTLRNHINSAEVTCKISEKQNYRKQTTEAALDLKLSILQQCSSIDPFISQEEDVGFTPSSINQGMEIRTEF